MAVGKDGTIVVGGSVADSLPGHVGNGWNDGFVRVYSPDGKVAWSDQIGRPRHDEVVGVAVGPDGRIYASGAYGIAGSGSAVRRDFLRAYSATGEVLWTRKFKIDGENVGVAAMPDGNVVVAGTISSALPGHTFDQPGGFIVVYSPSGDELWTKQFSTRESDNVSTIAAGGDNEIAVAGWIGGRFPGQISVGSCDGFVRVYSSSADVIWTDQFGAGGCNNATGVALSDNGRVAVTGCSEPCSTELECSNYGRKGQYVRVYSSAGKMLWRDSFKFPSDWSAWSVALDGSERTTVVGSTNAWWLECDEPCQDEGILRFYSPEGDLLSALAGIGRPRALEWPNAVASTKDNEIIIAGGVYGHGGPIGFTDYGSNGSAFVAKLKMPPQSPSCGSYAATMVGTPGPDVLVGTRGTDIIQARGADDLDGGYGKDRCTGGRGSDTLTRCEK